MIRLIRKYSLPSRSIALAFGLTYFCPAIGLASLGTDYEHPLAKELSIQKLDVVVSVQGPPRRVAGELSLELPPVVSPSGPLFLSGFVQTDSQSAVREAIKVFCDGRKIDCNFVIGAAGTSTEAAAIVETSTRTLAEHISQSSADAVLVIQANVIDEFSIDRGVGNTILETPQGREWVQDFRPEQSRGRLFLAQGFLFDRETGIRLWSRRAPEFPSTNRLRARDPFLKYGVVSSTDDQDLLAPESAKAFTEAFLSTLPKTEPFEDQAARARLRTVDRDLVEARLQLADRKPFALQLDVGWTRLDFALPATLFDDTVLPTIDPNSLTPNGVLMARANFTLFSEGRLLWNFAVPVYSDFSAGFARSYYQDEPLENQGLNARPRLVNIQYESLFGWGFEASSGLRFLLSPSWMLSTLFGAFYDNISIVVSPPEIKVPSNVSRFGVLGSSEITYFGPGGPEKGYFTATMRLKTGFDSEGYWILDPIFTLGAGILL